jgi:ADP-heptose:LPS heptosyltransferase
MGDVLLTLPVLAEISENNPGRRIIFVTDRRYLPYFKSVNIEAHGYDPANRHRGILGIIRLFSDLRRYRIAKVVDLHGVLRSYVLDALFLLNLKPVYPVRKYRKLRKQKLQGKENIEVPHTIHRYHSAIVRSGLNCRIAEHPLKRVPEKGNNGKVRLGFAPLARHTTKNWKWDHTEALMTMFLAQPEWEVFLFGGSSDRNRLESLASERVTVVAGRVSPDEEIEVLNTLHVFISMDSANMHLADLVGLPVVSIWGATDPALGFQAFTQPHSYSLYASQTEVSCRPCSVYGAIPCQRKDFPMLCMEKVGPERVFKVVKEILQKQSSFR